MCQSSFTYLEFLSLQVPHSLVLLEHRDLLCVADRENMRVACVGAKLRDPRPGPTAAFTIQQPDMGRVFAIASHGNTQCNVPLFLDQLIICKLYYYYFT